MHWWPTQPAAPHNELGKHQQVCHHRHHPVDSSSLRAFSTCCLAFVIGSPWLTWVLLVLRSDEMGMVGCASVEGFNVCVWVWQNASFVPTVLDSGCIYLAPCSVGKSHTLKLISIIYIGIVVLGCFFMTKEVMTSAYTYISLVQYICHAAVSKMFE